MKALNNKSMDIILQIDTTNVKKQGKELTIIPKIKIVQITTRGVNNGVKKTFGLNLSAFKQADDSLPIVWTFTQLTSFESRIRPYQDSSN